ncbi:MAG: ketol-acid reductoisomerase [Candidatus Omnitrophota bacterium]|nr:MAG: ketol-acid reductoisomerase [Candidatus Omnitrophota bacterium]
MAKVYYEQDANLEILENKVVGIIGYGSQGHAQAQNLRDSGINVIVSELPGTANYAFAKSHGFEPIEVALLVKQADIIQILVPDEFQAELYKKDIQPNLSAGKAIMFSHGFNINFKQIIPDQNIDVFMIAPKSPGHLVRSEYVKGGGVPCLVAVFQDASGKAKDIALAYGKGIGGAKAGIIETTFKEETETDLFGEQVVLCGGVSELVKKAFETLIEAGYQPEIAYFECLHELKLIVDLFYQGGISYMRYSVSNTAEYGDLTRGKRIINSNTKTEMSKILSEIQDGSFAREFIDECKNGKQNFKRMEQEGKDHPIEVVGRNLRKMMKWIDSKEV